MVKKTNTFKKKPSGNKSNRTRQKKERGKFIKSIFRFFKDERFHKVLGLFLIIVSILLLISFTSYIYTWTIDDVILNGDNAANKIGSLGARVSQLFIKNWFGVSSYGFILLFFVLGVRLLFKYTILPLGKTARYTLFFLLYFSVVLAFILKKTDFSLLGGAFGLQINNWLEQYLARIGTAFLLIFIALSFLIVKYNFPFRWIKLIKERIDKRKSEKSESRNTRKEDPYNTIEYVVNEDKDFNHKEESKKEPEPKTEELEIVEPPKDVTLPIDDEIPQKVNQSEKEVDNGVEFTIETPEPEDKEEPPAAGRNEHQTLDTEFDPRLDLPHYKYPPLNLLEDYGSDKVSVEKEELERNKNRIVETLNHYSIQIQKIKATIGPTVTLYEIIPAPGIRISKIKNLEDDIALSLAALGIRIIAPIPGKGTIGIEVPNQKPDIVSMKSVMASDKFQNTKFELPFGIGKTIANECFVADLAKMPHILMAGATGQGKSVGLNAVIASLLYKKHPAELKFVMVDPKKVELTLFSKIERHFLAKLPDSEEAIITDTRQVVRTLNSLSIEMDNRYELLKDAQVRNIKEYNVKFRTRKLNPLQGHRFLPYIVLVIDEFADLIMTAGKEIESPITRLAQLARAVGIHLIIATQRPSVNIITGSIKANFPARIAFRVISKIDSRTILDSGGADQLIGRGDMLLSTGSDLIRLQCAFVDTPEIDRLTEFIGSQRAYPDAFYLPECQEEESEGPSDFDPNERDDLFEDAARIIVQTQQGSTSLLQRKLKLGYNRAGRIIDQLEAAGIVGPFEGSKAREVKVANEMALEQFLKDLGKS